MKGKGKRGSRQVPEMLYTSSLLVDLLNYREHIQVHGRKIAVFIFLYNFESILFVKAHCLFLGVYGDISASNFLGEVMNFAYCSQEQISPYSRSGELFIHRHSGNFYSRILLITIIIDGVLFFHELDLYGVSNQGEEPG